MNPFYPIFKREFFGYFRSPIAYVFIVIFLIASLGCPFFLGGFYESNNASLQPFFGYLPSLYLVLVPAVGMRLWAEERRSGAVELLFTLPVTTTQAVVAKFCAGWAFLGVALFLTFPIALTVNYLGAPDNGVIMGGYLGSFLMAGTYLSITCFTSALTKSQVIAFILSALAGFVLVLLGWGVFTEMLARVLPFWLVDFISLIGFVPHFGPLSRGLVDTRDLLYFASIIAVALTLNGYVIGKRKTA